MVQGCLSQQSTGRGVSCPPIGAASNLLHHFAIDIDEFIAHQQPFVEGNWPAASKETTDDAVLLGACACCGAGVYVLCCVVICCWVGLIMLCCAVMIILRCAVMIMLCCLVSELRSAALCCAVQCGAVLYKAVMWCGVGWCGVVWCAVLCFAVLCCAGHAVLCFCPVCMILPSDMMGWLSRA